MANAATMNGLANAQVNEKTYHRHAGHVSNKGHVKGRAVREKTSASSQATAPHTLDHHNVRLSKAQSSLSASAYQAQGHLPQYNGSGQAHVSSVLNQNVSCQAQRSLALNVACQDGALLRSTSSRAPPVRYEQETYGCANVRNLAVTFGYDGSGDAADKKEIPKPGMPNGHNNRNFDYRGVTVADYKPTRSDPNSSWHRGQVDDFFEDIAAKEAERMKKARANNKTA